MMKILLDLKNTIFFLAIVKITGKNKQVIKKKNVTKQTAKPSLVTMMITKPFFI